MRADDAVHLFEEMQCKGLTPSTVTCNIVLQGLFRVGRSRAARKVFDKMLITPIISDWYTYCVMLDGLCKGGHIEEALNLLHKMEIQRLDLKHITMYNIILDGLCKSGRLDGARDLFNSLFLKGLDPDVITYNTMILGLCSIGLLKEAKGIFIKMKENGCLANGITYNVIVQGLLLGGKYDDALVHLEEMDNRGFLLHSHTFSKLLNSLKKSENDPYLLKKIQKFVPNMKE
ncbi:unnamed protein product [Coffea canephora]|uniref:Pentacotripeptide-repeat region of PRORP domain-containing protein n=1 Tax=Coffea canephora TaxID=49390 RepID=A0A068VC34_COFCA|nr:unnamed protein product [Coffea canephora]